VTIFQIVGIIAGLAQLIGYIDYISFVKRGVINPSTGSWLIWSYGNAIVCWIYILGGTLSFQETLPFVCSIACMLTGLYFLYLRKFERPEWWEYLVLSVDVLITIYWLKTRDTELAQTLLQISVMISFIPILRGVWINPNTERKRPWIIWSIAYALLFFAESPYIYMWREHYWKFIYPINYFLWHFIVATLAAKTKTSNKTA